MSLGLINPVPNFNFTLTMWDVPTSTDAGSILTSVASAAINVVGQMLFGEFCEVQGINADIEVETYQQGGENNRPHRFFKQAKYSNLVLKKGVTSGTTLWDWHNQILINNVKIRKSGILVLYERNGLNLVGAGLPGLDRTPVAAWMFDNGLPEQVHGPTLNAKGNEISIETLEISHEGLRRVSLSMIPGLSGALGDLAGLGAAGVGAGISAATTLL